jgi:rhodanese-related sulfurtransferase
MRLSWLQVTAAVKGNKDTPIVISCWGGGLSRIGSSLLISAGFKDIKNLYYGVS